MATKICTSCKETKSIGQFHIRRASPDGLALICKACNSIKNKARYAQKKHHIAAKARAWALANPERRLAIRRKSAAKLRLRRRAAARAYAVDRRVRDPDGARMRGRRYAAIRRTREQDAGGSVSAEWWQALFDLIETNACLYCRRTDRQLTMDHWLPVKLGGKTEIGNLVPCCKSCNSSKGVKHPDLWLKMLGAPSSGLAIPAFLRATRDAFSAAALYPDVTVRLT